MHSYCCKDILDCIGTSNEKNCLSCYRKIWVFRPNPGFSHHNKNKIIIEKNWCFHSKQPIDVCFKLIINRYLESTKAKSPDNFPEKFKKVNLCETLKFFREIIFFYLKFG